MNRTIDDLMKQADRHHASLLYYLAMGIWAVLCCTTRERRNRD